MAFATKVQLNGDNHEYRLSPELKKYTLSDLGFKETRLGNFEFKRSLDPTSPYAKKAIKVKITINQDLTEFKLAVVDGSEMKNVDIFGKDNFAEEKQQFTFLMQNMILRKVFVKEKLN